MTSKIDTLSYEDQLIELESGDDSVTGGRGADTIIGNLKNNILIALAGNDLVEASDGNDTIDGGEGVDTMLGGEGNDIIYVDNQRDMAYGGGGDDTVFSKTSFALRYDVENLTLIDSAAQGLITGTGNELDNSITGNGSANILYGAGGNDTLSGGGGNDMLDGGEGDDSLIGGEGDDVFLVNSSRDKVVEYSGEGNDTIKSTIGLSLQLLNNIENLTLKGIFHITGQGNSLNNFLQGNSGNNILDGARGNDSLSGGDGNDSLSGGEGNDVFFGDNGNDLLNGGAGIDLVDYSATSTDITLNLKNGISTTQGRDTLNSIEGAITGDGDDTLIGNSLSNRLVGGDGNDILLGAEGNDTLSGGAGPDSIVGGYGRDMVDYSTSAISVRVDLGYSIQRSGEAQGDTLIGIEDILGSANRDSLTGNSLNNIIEGGGGGDLLSGGGGIDLLSYANSQQAVRVDLTNSNPQSFGDAQGDTISGFENLQGSRLNDTLLGNSHTNYIAGGDGNDSLIGRSGADSLIGGTGNDTLAIDSTNAFFDGGSGSDWIVTTVATDLTNAKFQAVENILLTGTNNLVLSGDSGSNYLSGNQGKNTLIGRDGDDTLDGGQGADSLIGGAGDDVYIVDGNNDIILESNFSGGKDLVLTTSSNFTLGKNLENLTCIGSISAKLTGNSIANKLTGGNSRDTLVGENGNDTLDGNSGADSLVGGIGNDVYFIENINDIVVERAGEGNDTVYVSSDLDIAFIDNVETLIFANAPSGGSGNDLLVGSSRADTLNGLAGNDTVLGQRGTDSLVGGLGNDSILGGDGEDTISGDAGNDSISGDSGNDLIFGGAGNDYLLADLGSDTIAGGQGNDTYYVNELGGGTKINELTDEGVDTIVTDLVNVLVNFNAGAYTNVEKIVFNGNAASTLGDEFDNTLIGGDKSDTLNGKGGNDTLLGLFGNDSLDGGNGTDFMSGGSGNDTYFVDNLGDKIRENADEGQDLVIASITFSLANTPNVENLTLGGVISLQSVAGGNDNNATLSDANLNATGNPLSNNIKGNSGNNSLDGGGGGDSLVGGNGADTLQGGLGDSVADFLNGGNGNDIYFVDSTIDLISDTSGIDSIYTSISFSLNSGNVTDIENLVYTGKTKATLSGNASRNSIVGSVSSDTLFGDEENDTLEGNGGDDSLVGGAGEDSLVGGLGADTMAGGLGNDFYVIDNIRDKAFEGLTGGLADRVQSNVSYTLAENFEVLELAGREFIHGTGNATNNSLFGNVGNNSLFGLGGNDTLDGGLGSDTLDGGIGNDYYIVESDTDKIIDLSGNDTLETAFNNIDLGSKSDFRVLEGLVLAGSANVATGNSLNNIITSKNRSATASRKFYGALGDDTLYGGVGADLLSGQEGNDTILGGTNIKTGEADSDSASNTLSGGVGNDFLEGGAGGDLLLGGTNGYAGFSDRDAESSANRDTLVGGDGNDTLDGGLGLDSMLGGQGDDFYYAESSQDVFFEAKDQGNDTVLSKASLDLSKFGSIENAILTGSADNFLKASDINNFIKGNVGRNSLSGLGGDDTMDGGDGTDTLDGGAGFDLIDGGAGSDYMLGGLGNDTFIVDNAEDRIIESDVVDSGRDEVKTSINFDPISPWLVEFGFDPAADDGSPSITKQKSFAYLDRDKFQNLENFTFVGPAARGIGNALDNSFSGNALDNIVLAQGGNDTLIGNAGNDSLYGESDGLYATAADLYSSNPQPAPTGFSALIKYLEDEITGGFLGVGADYVDGGEGNDYIDGGALNDTMIGGAGNDTIVIDNEEDILNEDSGAGIDWVVSSINVYALAENFENLHLNVQQPSPWQGENAGGADPGQPEQTAPARVAVGNGINNLITVSYAKDDPITIEDESITQFPQQTVASISEVIANNSTKSMSWQIPTEPNDNTVPHTNFVAQFRRSGTSQWITQKWDIRPVDSSYTFSSLEIGVQYDFRVQALGVTTLEGRGGDDSLIGADFRESLLGGAGNDYLDGAVGDDMLAGGFGNDTLVVDSLSDAMLEFGLEGRDMVVSSITLDLSDNIVETGKFMEDMKASDPAGGINLSGNRLDNSLIGNDYDNQLFGEIGNDSLIGGNGYDWLSGDDGNDWLLGALLTGDKEFTQIDTLTGGAGADTFALNSVRNGSSSTLRYLVSNQGDYALITDFEIGSDKLNLGAGDFGFGNLPAGITTGQAIYYIPPLPLAPNLIAVIQTTTGNPANLADL